MFAYIALILGVLLITWAYMDPSGQSEDGRSIGGTLLLILVIVTSFIGYITQTCHLQDVKRYERYLEIDRERTAQLVPALQAVLSKYPEHEKEIMLQFTSSGGGRLISVPPALRSDTSFAQIAKEIRTAQEITYEHRRALIDMQCGIELMRTTGRKFLLRVP